ncbi:MAG TPA: hypothetical protein VFE33_34490 [Thermoanaerobaculia bacterium]|nr:hypothetical protein [Thermoanaerobaculia bacterium]
MRKLIILLALAVTSLVGATASATTCNIDFTATISQQAYDFALVLHNTHASITATYNGTSGSDDVFSGFSASFSGPDEILHWTGPQSVIVNGTQIHVGWTTSDNTCPPCITGYFTDRNGLKIPGTDVAVLVTNHVAGSSGFFSNICAIPITLTNIRGACLAAPIKLGDLNRTNSALAAQLQDLSSGATLKPGDEIAIPLPVPPRGGSCGAYVFNYGIVGQSNAQISPWVQLP